jgi:predicted AAA+ superfamily ATPase
MYYHRQLEKTVLKAADEFACVTLYGARQTGKSTMVRTMFENIEYVTMDNSRERTLAKQDPELFLESHGIPLIIDEIQKVDL